MFDQHVVELEEGEAVDRAGVPELLQVGRLEVEQGVGDILLLLNVVNFFFGEIAGVVVVWEFPEVGFQGVYEGEVAVDHMADEGLLFLVTVGLCVVEQTSGPGTGVVDEGPPDHAGLPPPVVGLVVIEADKESDGGTQYGRYGHGDGYMGRQPEFVHKKNNGTTKQQHQVYLPGEGEDLCKRETVFQQHMSDLFLQQFIL